MTLLREMYLNVIYLFLYLLSYKERERHFVTFYPKINKKNEGK
jgi:hypothetical protein